MSQRRGSPTVTFRIAPLLLAALRAEIERYNQNPMNEQHTMTTFVNQAIVEKLRHRKASRTKPRKTRSLGRETVLGT